MKTCVRAAIFPGAVAVWFALSLGQSPAAPPAEAQSGDASAVMEKVKKRLDGLSTLSCSFRRDHLWKELGKSQVIEGTIRLKNPGKLRVEYPAQTIVSDGKTSWAYTPRNKQVVITRAKEGGEDFPTPRSIFERYAGRKAEYAGTGPVGGSVTDILHLIPDTVGEDDVTVWIDRALSFPVRTVETQPNGDVTTSELTKVVINGKLGDDLFTFKAPAGVSAVDMRE
jgi:outer membrane lipoprotein carrier protein